MKIAFKPRPFIISASVMLLWPVFFSLLDTMEYWTEPLILLTGGFVRMLFAIPYGDEKFMPLLYMTALVAGSLAWFSLLLLPSLWRKCDRAGFYLLQSAYALSHAWLGIWIIGTKHC